ncbi:SLC5/6 family protein [Azotobacter armeniacus]
MTELHFADYAVLAVYLVVVIAVCVRVARASPDTEELFLAGRSLGWGVVGLSLFASNISSTTLIGLPGAAWQSGIAVANYEWMAAAVLLFSTFTVVPIFLGRRITTIPELLEQRFDGRMRRYLSGVTIFLSIVLDTAGSLYAGAVVLMQFVPGLSLIPTCIGIALFTGLYTAAGGLRAVAYTDTLQTTVLLIGSAVLAWIVFGQFDHSWSQVSAALGEERLSLIRPLDDPELPWLGTLIGLPILGFYYWTMNQYVSQRLLGARDMRAAGWGAVLAANLKLLPLFIMVLPGAMAAVLLPDLERADAVFPQLIAHYAPVGLAGLIVAGLLAAIMSSIDSALNSASTLITLDFIQHRHPSTDARRLARTGRVVTLLLVVLAASWAPAIDNFPGLFAYLQQGFTYIAAPMVATFILMFVGRRVGPRGALYGTATGHALSAAWFAASQAGLIELHFTIVAGVLLLATLLACRIWAGLLGEPVQEPLTQPRAAVPRTLLLGAGLTALLTLVIVAGFW